MTPLSRLLSPPGRPGLFSTQQALPAVQMGVACAATPLLSVKIQLCACLLLFTRVPFLGRRAHRHWHVTRCRMQRPASRASARAWSAGVCRLALKRTIPHCNRHS